jgi:preprotein translocase subunit SecF
MNIIKYEAIPFTISSILFLVSVVLLVTLGLKPGIDFTGGSLIEVAFTQAERPSVAQVTDSLAPLSLGEVQIQPAGDTNMIIKTRFISEEEHQSVLRTLRDAFPADQPSDATDTVNETSPIVVDTDGEGVVQMIDVSAGLGSAVSVREERVETVGPSISAHLVERAWEIGLAVIVAIILYVAYAFRKVSKPVSSWKFGVTAVIALVHDVMITIGVFALLGHFLDVEVNISFVVALLTILGYSVNDTIVVFDRIRENLVKYGYSKFEYVINTGVNQTLVRSFNTSFTTLLVLFALFFFGGESIKYFALALIVGIGFGTYSSIFLASPLLAVWERIGKRS